MENAAVVGLVVCCRYKEYTDLDVRLALNAAIRLQRLSREQVFSYIGGAVRV